MNNGRIAQEILKAAKEICADSDIPEPLNTFADNLSGQPPDIAPRLLDKTHVNVKDNPPTVECFYKVPLDVQEKKLPRLTLARKPGPFSMIIKAWYRPEKDDSLTVFSHAGSHAMFPVGRHEETKREISLDSDIDDIEDAMEKTFRSVWNKLKRQFGELTEEDRGELLKKLAREHAPSFELDESRGDEFLFATREHGDVGSEQAGQEDIDDAKDFAQAVKDEFPDAKVDMEVVDEWVHVNIKF